MDIVGRLPITGEGESVIWSDPCSDLALTFVGLTQETMSGVPHLYLHGTLCHPKLSDCSIFAMSLFYEFNRPSFAVVASARCPPEIAQESDTTGPAGENGDSGTPLLLGATE